MFKPVKSMDELAEEWAPWVADKLNELQTHAKTKKHDQIKYFIDLIWSKLHEVGLAYFDDVPNMQVTVCHDNRNGDGLTPRDVHDLQFTICRKGFSWGELREPRAAELPPVGSEERQPPLDFCEKMVQKADGYLAPYNKDTVRIASATCSHTVAGLRNAEFGTKGWYPELCTDGILSRQKIFEFCPSYEEPMKRGLKWSIARWQLVKRVPSLMMFTQEAGNACNSAARRETTVQVLLAIHQKSTKFDDWDLIRTMLARHHEWLENELVGYCKYVENFSGGKKTPKYLQELEAFGKTCDLKREISGQFFLKIGSAPLSKVPEYVTACTKAELCAPSVQNGFAKLFIGEDIQSMSGTNASNVLAATGLMRHARNLITELNEANADLNLDLDNDGGLIRIIGELDIRLVMFVHKKNVQSRRKFDSLNEIMDAFCDDLEAAYPQVKGKLPKSPGVRCAQKRSQPTTSSKQEQKPKKPVIVREYTSAGTLQLSKEDIEKLGWKIGAEVEHTPCPNLTLKYSIIEIGSDDVTLKPIDDTTTGNESAPSNAEAKERQQRIPFASMLDQYKIIEKVENVLLEDPPDPLTQLDFKCEDLKSQWRLALIAAWKDCHSWDDVVIQTSPERKVLAKRSIDVGGLTLVPLSPAIALSYKKEVSSAIATGGTGIFNAKKEELFGFIQPKLDIPAPMNDKKKLACKTTKTDPFVVPFWAIKTAADSKFANMIMKKHNVSINLGGDNNVTFAVPVLKNTTKLVQGDELLKPAKLPSDKTPTANKRLLEQITAIQKRPRRRVVEDDDSVPSQQDASAAGRGRGKGSRARGRGRGGAK